MNVRIALIARDAGPRVWAAEILTDIPGIELLCDEAVAWIMLDRLQPDLLVLGIEAARGAAAAAPIKELVARCPDAIVIALSGTGRPRVVHAALAAGARGFVVHGEDLALVEAVLRFADPHRSARHNAEPVCSLTDVV